MRYLTALLLCIAQVPFSFGQDGCVEGNPSLAYWKIGNKKQVVIMLHGGPAAPHDYLRPEFDALAASAKVIYYDQRGCGKSDRAESYLWQEHLSDLRRVIQKFSRNRKVFLTGSSWGSTLAIMYAYTYPEDVKGIILSGTYAWEGKGKPYNRKLLTFHNRPHKQLMVENRSLTSINDTGQVFEKNVEISKEIELYSGSPLNETKASFVSGPPIDSLRKMNVPVLIFNGDRADCKIDRGQEFVRIFSNAQLHAIPGACHDPWFSRPDLFFSKCAEFMKSVKRER